MMPPKNMIYLEKVILLKPGTMCRVHSHIHMGDHVRLLAHIDEKRQPNDEDVDPTGLFFTVVSLPHRRSANGKLYAFGLLSNGRMGFVRIDQLEEVHND